jgi:hypothetical protein
MKHEWDKRVIQIIHKKRQSENNMPESRDLETRRDQKGI